jgi:hypothetical protein
MKKFLLSFFVTVAPILIASTVLSWFFQPIAGDLTRIGNFADRDFGWREVQPAVRTLSNQVSTPNVLVLGDSFSRENDWQTAFTESSGLVTRSYHYDDVGCIDNWINAAISQKGADTIIVQSIERLFVYRFKDVTPCGESSVYPFTQPMRTSITLPSTWPPEWHMSHSFAVAMNTIELNAAKSPIAHEPVVVAPMRPHCANFSNRRSDWLLYLDIDGLKTSWTTAEQQQAVSNVLRLQSTVTHAGKKFVFVLVPDKLTVYRNCLVSDIASTTEPYPNAEKVLIDARVNMPQLVNAFISDSRQYVDFYKPNDTHLSTTGYRRLGHQVSEFVVMTHRTDKS